MAISEESLQNILYGITPVPSVSYFCHSFGPSEAEKRLQIYTIFNNFSRMQQPLLQLVDSSLTKQ